MQVLNSVSKRQNITTISIHLVGMTSVYVNSGLRLVNLAVLVYLPLTQRGSPAAIESERKDVQQLLKFVDKSYKTFRL